MVQATATATALLHEHTLLDELAVRQVLAHHLHGRDGRALALGQHLLAEHSRTLLGERRHHQQTGSPPQATTTTTTTTTTTSSKEVSNVRGAVGGARRDPHVRAVRVLLLRRVSRDVPSDARSAPQAHPRAVRNTNNSTNGWRSEAASSHLCGPRGRDADTLLRGVQVRVLHTVLVGEHRSHQPSHGAAGRSLQGPEGRLVAHPAGGVGARQGGHRARRSPQSPSRAHRGARRPTQALATRRHRRHAAGARGQATRALGRPRRRTARPLHGRASPGPSALHSSAAHHRPAAVRRGDAQGAGRRRLPTHRRAHDRAHERPQQALSIHSIVR